MDTYNAPEPTGSYRNPLKGMGQKLKLHFIIPIIYAVILITVFIVSTCK